MVQDKDLKIAILIDADNVSSKKIEEIINEVNRYGVPTIKRIYGDWTRPYVDNWKSSLLTHAITPIQQYSYTQGKNSTDSALIIDAMDILHSDRVDGFCIVSSDSDFTRLATRLRESGKLVIGIGERKTPKPFIASCDKFIYVEILEKITPTKKVEKNEKPEKNEKRKSTPTNNNPATNNNGQINKPTPAPVEQVVPTPLDEETLLMLKDAVDDTADESGWAFLGEIGSLIIKRKPDFDARNYGFEKISSLFKARKDDFEIDERSKEKSRNKLYYVRNILNANIAPIAEVPASEETTVNNEIIATQDTEIVTPKPKQKSKRKKTPEPKKAIESEKIAESKPVEDATPSYETVIIPSKGNKITADDVKKNQLRITKDLKALFPTETRKLRIIIKNEFECNFSFRKDSSHVLSLGKAAATELGLEEGNSFQILKLEDFTFKIVKTTDQ